jgi:hypothetical protein
LKNEVEGIKRMIKMRKEDKKDALDAYGFMRED